MKNEGYKRLGLLLIMGGALGNLYDRIFYKAVPDFLDLHIGNFHWFIFNVADIFITTTSVERLDKLAEKYYEDSSLWWVIAAANGLGKGSYIIPKNTSLRIPNATSIRDAVLNINRNR